jgi:Mg-chelatase subunit ChlI
MTPLCVGCSQPLPVRRARGRPARYHGPACRQRARRARLSVDPGRVELLAVAARAEHAALALRRAVTAGQDHDAAVAELLAAADALTTTLRDNANGEPTSLSEASQDSPVTKSVTDTAPRPVAPESDHLAAGPAQPSGEFVTEYVTEQDRRGAPSRNGGHRRSIRTPYACNEAPTTTSPEPGE